MNSQYVNRIIRACRLDVNLYEEVEADKSATFQAAGVVVLSSLAAGAGVNKTFNFFITNSLDKNLFFYTATRIEPKLPLYLSYL